MKLRSEASLQIQKPVEQVFEAIIHESKMTNYFISESSGDLADGKDLMWKFPEFDQRFPITKVKTIENEEVSFVWDPTTVVSIKLEAFDEHSTIIRVSEEGKDQNDENLKWLISNVGGWANFLASMKAYLEYGINLRKGAYEFMRKS